MFGFWKRIKASFQRYLDHMAKENQKEFGGSAPDCCTLNRAKNGRTGRTS